MVGAGIDACRCAYVALCVVKSNVQLLLFQTSVVCDETFHAEYLP